MELSEFIIRISVCLLLSILIGIERQYRNGTVGLRTNVLVAIGSFMFNYATYGFVGHDQSRIASSIVSGIGFLGAGVIIHDGKDIKGLNTASTLWCVAAIGLLTSTGMLIEASIGTGFVLISNIFLRLISFFIMDRVKKYYRQKCTIDITCSKNIEMVVRNSFSEYVEKNGLRLLSMDKSNNSNDSVKLVAVVITSRVNKIDTLIKNISAEPEVSSISWDHSKYYVSDNEDDSLDA